MTREIRVPLAIDTTGGEITRRICAQAHLPYNLTRVAEKPRGVKKEMPPMSRVRVRNPRRAAEPPIRDGNRRSIGSSPPGRSARTTGGVFPRRSAIGTARRRAIGHGRAERHDRSEPLAPTEVRAKPCRPGGPTRRPRPPPPPVPPPASPPRPAPPWTDPSSTDNDLVV
ncbi:hypothetical protein PUN28_019637 [Cardiocondyla obscurior]|uniref:Uncharacterized protein n=1 Tax=Cardiocondyla obscurior TaxID=286306 RepID=A0AAW2EDN2_9HYME